MLFKQVVFSLQTKSNLIKLLAVFLTIFALLSGCTSPLFNSGKKTSTQPLDLPFDYDKPNPDADIIQMPNSRWVPAAWSDLPGWNEDQVGEAWQAWVQSCRLFPASWIDECGQIIHLTHADENSKRQWMYNNLQPYRVESLQGEATGMLTAYYEPIFRARRLPIGAFKYPLYYAPDNLNASKPYWSRKEIESNPRAQNELKKHVFAYLDDPLDVLILHIQGSGQLILTEPDGSTRVVRAAFSASNNHGYKSVGRYLLDRKLITDGTWDGIRAWLEKNPARLNEVLWSNPRYIFFREDEIADPLLGPLGAQGVPLSYGRSVAVDKSSVPYGTPLWISSEDANHAAPGIQKLVLAQDTGSAIVGAVRVDYFWGKGPAAGEQAGRTKQTLRMWTFLPRSQKTASTP